MALIDNILSGGVFVPSSVKVTNFTGTPVTSGAANADGRAIADNYSLTFDSVVAATSANVTVLPESPSNPYRGTTAIVLDGVTAYKDIIPGLTLVFSNAGGFLNTWQAIVKAGEPLGSFDAYGAGAGIPSEGSRHKVVNSGAGAVSNAKAQILNIVKWYAKTGKVFSQVRNFAAGSTEKIAGGGSSRIEPYKVAVSGVAGAGDAKTVTLKIDGADFAASSIKNLATGATQNGTAIRAVAGITYEVVLGVLTGLQFQVAPATANGDVANVLIFAARYVQIAPDVSGTAGAYDITDVTLTQGGEASGVIQSGGAAYFWKRILIPNGANSESNPYPTDVSLTGTETGAADWTV